jgi:hypothetical protein
VLDVQVEIINAQLYHIPSFFFIASTHPLVIPFEHARVQIIELLNTMIRRRWRMLCPFNMGIVQNKAQPAIAVVVGQPQRAALRRRVAY